jgi:RNA polymerase sigma factor (sigma-70 family)
VHVTLEDSDAIAGGAEPLGVAAEDLNAALDRPAALDERRARVVELRFFTGLSVEETAEVLGVSPATVKRDWTLARAWLHRELKGRIA